MEYLTTSADQGPQEPRYEAHQMWVLPYEGGMQGAGHLPTCPHGEDHLAKAIRWGGASFLAMREPHYLMFMEARDRLRRTLWPHPSWSPPPTLRVPEPTGGRSRMGPWGGPWGSGSVNFPVNLMGPNGGNPSSLQLGPSGRSKFSARGRHYHMQSPYGQCGRLLTQYATGSARSRSKLPCAPVCLSPP